MNKNIIKAVIILVIGVVIIGGITVYSLPKNEINRYITEFQSKKSNLKMYPDNIADFLNFQEQNGLPAPLVKQKVINRSLNKVEILTGFEVMTYNSNNELAHVYSGELLFLLHCDKLNWNINTVEVIHEMQERR
ncbi:MULTISPECIES: hypothetical protein [unclassified Paenibacillus]|uniref:hypothetical protein n=1 Tax=unclassified Paenibacillus TaxID=185978 RepID=UPI0024076AB9|nr:MULTISPECIES: hypothetical protein [unclassified Paenibacillus]MDF9844310.1 hypothetical protein [Paenibacillus sp. PastF-2]MDF9850901.1 hypothetical protein [Paenibacillus sp. PastM-2]MDF9857485.1 hypothetical protein [Paenibacillus sp. PastF-1]MDH6482739.1 hypothetical protein [Paenibacillus sp. PastH-2]MDH6510165.1 hypothetical protein [Paenibacillus sp. PastM-3]